MSPLWLLVSGLAIVVSAGWFATYLYGWRQMDAMRRASELDPPEPTSWRRVTVAVPARNERDSVEQTLRSLASQDYPDLEVLAVDDRSTDGTGEIIDRLAEEFDAIRALHVDQLPDGWMGKQHALHRAVREATGDWLLFTDGDVEYARGALRHLVAVAEDDSLDQLACVPNMKTAGFWHELTYAGFLTTTMMMGTNVRRIQDPDDDAYMGVGAFNLVRADFFAATKGFEWLRMEVSDDLGVGRLVSDNGGRQDVVLADDLLELEWYDGMWSMIEGFEKNGVGVMGHYSPIRVAGTVAAWAVFSLSPLVGLFSPFSWARIASGLALATLPLNNLKVARFGRRPVLPTLLAYGGVWIMMFALARSTYHFLRRGGIEWRGTFYPADQLREHQRVQL